jgi:xanthine dehydrogenase molybdopterin-binding subunit B
MQGAIRRFFALMPFFFGIGFIAPLIAQSMAALHVAAPMGMSLNALGLAIGAPWGLYATAKGRWL